MCMRCVGGGLVVHLCVRVRVRVCARVCMYVYAWALVGINQSILVQVYK